MRVLIIGQGGREHALHRSLSQSHSIEMIPWTNNQSVLQHCLEKKPELIIIGPEDPLVAGLADQLRAKQFLVVGPSQEGAKLEGSKIFAKEFMVEAKIPTAPFKIVASVEQTLAEARHFTTPYVLKADGLAAGKGVFICKTLEELREAATELFEKKSLGLAGARALLEQFTGGWELSYLLLTNGFEYQSLPLAQDHKRLLDNDEGPNTGGMGTVAPLTIDPTLQKQIETTVIEPTLKLLQKRNILFRGVIFIGLMINDKSPSVLEYNCRFGDPETQVILPLIDGDLGEILLDLAQGKVLPVKQKNIFASCVVLASPGYPSSPQKGLEISGELAAGNENQYFIKAGVGIKDGKFITNGGRVLCSIGLGKDLKESLARAYDQSRKVTWPGIQYRKDIGKKII